MHTIVWQMPTQISNNWSNDNLKLNKNIWIFLEAISTDPTMLQDHTSNREQKNKTTQNDFN